MTENPKKVCHVTTVHKCDDTRIFLKECLSLADFYKVYLVYLGEKVRHDKVNLISAGKSQNSRLKRFSKGIVDIYSAAIKINADIYHLHDPELLLVGLLLKLHGKKVLYDAHEDLPRQILTKPWIKKPIRKCIATLTELFEDTAVKFFDGIIAATSHIAKRFAKNNAKVVTINNYPLLHELRTDVSIPWQEKEPQVCYVGGITYIRGICECVAAISKTNVKLGLAGTFESKRLHDAVAGLNGWTHVNKLGQLDREAVKLLLAKSIAGLVLFHSAPNHVFAQPNKMFEYMSAGIPVIASDFPLWKEFIEGNRCGICVDPLNPDEIADAIKWIVEHPAEAEEMGNNGRRAVEHIYNWNIEKEKLFTFYEKLI
ncbi:glycosyltransferase [Sporomusa sphaeroides]|uniref:glycosyltransferase n=1 Tax=Sporomusa sphaeroides TaxID=47679 RepID=UPI003DA1C455